MLALWLMRSNVLVPFGLVATLTAACNTTPPPTSDSPPSASVPQGVLRLGAALEASAPQASLDEISRAPGKFLGKTFTTAGTVTAVCQHRGCWMELKDAAGQAHVKMAGHAFFVPKTASGHNARVLAKLVSAEPQQDSCEGAAHAATAPHGGSAQGCRAEAEKQLGRPLAKLELVAEGVELL